jgi:hypothetical protein
MIEKDIEQRAIAKINNSGWFPYFPPLGSNPNSLYMVKSLYGRHS